MELVWRSSECIQGGQSRERQDPKVHEVDASREVKSWHAWSLVAGQGPQARQEEA